MIPKVKNNFIYKKACIFFEKMKKDRTFASLFKKSPLIFGEMAEWSIAAVLKTVEL